MGSQSGGVLKAAGVMGAATLLSRLMGLIREQVFAFLFGAGNMTDAYNVAFRIPNLLRDLFAEGAMSASLVPTFTQAQVEEGQDRAWRVAGLVFRVLFVSVSFLAILGIIFAPNLVGLYASAFKAIPGKFELTVRMTRIMFPFFPLVAVAAAFMGILNACGVYFLPAFASALFNLTSVIIGIVFAQILFLWGGQIGMQPIEGMAIGVVAGGMVQALCQLPALYRKGYQWKEKTASDFKWSHDPRLKQMLWMMVPGTLGLAATQINLLVNTVLATSQGPGAVSWLNYAFRLMQFPIGIFGVSLASATLPRIAHLWAIRDIEGVTDTLSQSLRSVFAVNLPASAGLAFLGYPIIELIFQYGRFYSEDTRSTALALAMYSVGLTAYSAVKVLVPACYALGNTKLPVISSFLAVGVTIILNLLFIRPFGYWGLALGTSIAAISNCIFLVYALQRLIQEKGGKFRTRELVISFFQYLMISMLMGGICWISSGFLTSFLPDSLFFDNFGRIGIPVARIVRVGILVCEGIFLIVSIARIFKLKEATEFIDLFSKKMKKKLSRNST